MMMKRLVILLLPLILLGGCREKEETKKEEEEHISYREPHYNEVENLHIHWSDLLTKQDGTYYAYVYSVYCTQCSYLREKIVNFAKSNVVPFYFVDPNDDVAFTDDMTLVENSLGASKLEDVYIHMTPTLIGISDHVVSFYAKEYNEINSFIDSYGD